uniref:KH domain containing protein, putative n=1 Tax=Theileria annulata TaxID=5874 RepID=A0A3B0MY92_THEAN
MFKRVISEDKRIFAKMNNTQKPSNNSNMTEQDPNREIQDFISEGISNIILSKPEYHGENMSPLSKETYNLNSKNIYYMNFSPKNDDTSTSALTHNDDYMELMTNADMSYMTSLTKNEVNGNETNHVRTMDNQLLLFGDKLDNFESSLSYQFGIIDTIKNALGSNPNENYSDLTISSPDSGQMMISRPDFQDDKSEGISKNFCNELSYGEHIIYNKIDTLQKMIKNMVMTMHEKYNVDSNLKYDAFPRDSTNESNYDFTLAQLFSQKSPRRSFLKILASHGVIGSFFGSNGHRVQALQQEFSVNVSVTTKRIHFPGSNNKGVLLINGKLYNILKVLRPLYRAIQEEVIRLLIDESVRIEPSKIRLEIEVLIPESLRFTMDRNKHFKQIMDMTGANIRVIKQTYEDGPVQERVLVLFGSQNEVELALEKIALMIQDDTGFKHYTYMNYPELTIALNGNDRAIRYYQKKFEAENKCKKNSNVKI